MKKHFDIMVNMKEIVKKNLTNLLNELDYNWVGEENAKRFPFLSDIILKSSKTCGITVFLI